MKKKIFSVILSALMISAFLCSCGGEKAVSSLPDTSSATYTSSVPDTPSVPATSSATYTPSVPATSSAAVVAENLYTYDHVTLNLPKNFSVSEQNSIPVALSSDSNTGDNITFSKTAADQFDAYTEEVLTSSYQQVFAGFKESKSFKKTKISGLNTIVYSYTASVNNVEMTGTQYFIFGSDYTDIVTFTDASGKYSDAFNTCAASITVK